MQWRSLCGAMSDGPDASEHAGGRLAESGGDVEQGPGAGEQIYPAVYWAFAKDGAHALGGCGGAGIFGRGARAVQAGWSGETGHGAQRGDAGSTGGSTGAFDWIRQAAAGYRWQRADGRSGYVLSAGVWDADELEIAGGAGSEERRSKNRRAIWKG